MTMLPPTTFRRPKIQSRKQKPKSSWPTCAAGKGATMKPSNVFVRYWLLNPQIGGLASTLHVSCAGPVITKNLKNNINASSLSHETPYHCNRFYRLGFVPQSGTRRRSGGREPLVDRCAVARSRHKRYRRASGVG